MVELDDNVRMGLLIGAAAIVIFVLVMTGIVFGDKLFLIDLIGVGDQEAFRPSQDLALKTYWPTCGSRHEGLYYFRRR